MKGIDDYLGQTRKEAVRKARRALMTVASRGVVCFGCNTGIRKFRDKPELLESAAKYLRTYNDQLKALNE